MADRDALAVGGGGGGVCRPERGLCRCTPFRGEARHHCGHHRS